jgi:hypothetical protein
LTAVPGPGVVPGRRVRLPLGTVIGGAVVVTLLRPLSWALGLAGFLAGGGVIVVAWPIVVLPTLTGLQNALGGPVSSLVFGGPSSGLVAIIAVGIAMGIGLVVLGTIAGAWAERQGIAVALDAAADDGMGLATADLDRAPGAGRVALVRLLGLAPVVIAVALAWRPLYDATYHELILPSSLSTPLPLRVIREAPLPVIGIVVTWLLADAAAAVGVRRLVLERRRVFEAWLLGWSDLVRRPHRILPAALAGLLVLVLMTGPALLAAAIGWGRVRDILVGGRDPLIVLAAVLVWVAIWLGCLVLAGVGSAVRAATWTLEASTRPGERPPPWRLVARG